MHINSFKTLLSFITFGYCHAAVTWRTFNCGNYMFNGGNIDQIWDNANAMIAQAQSQISLIPDSLFGVMKGTDNGKIAGANAKLMWGIKYGKTGIDSAGKATMATISTEYTEIQKALARTLTGANNFNLNNAILFCGSNGFIHGIPPGSDYVSDVWYATITTGTAPNTVTEYFVPNYAVGFNKPQPCTEVVKKQVYIAMTSSATQFVNGVKTNFISIMLCFNKKPGMKPTLDEGFLVSSGDASPDDYACASGALIHEMAHVVGLSRNVDWADDGNYGFIKCVDLARKDPITALTTPDNYNLFAVMSMSPATKWKPPLPPPEPATPAT